MKQDSSLAHEMNKLLNNSQFNTIFRTASDEQDVKDSSDDSSADDLLVDDSSADDFQSDDLSTERMLDLLNEEPVAHEEHMAEPAFGEKEVEPVIYAAFAAVHSLVKASASLDQIGLTTAATETLELANFISEAAKKKVEDKKKAKKDKKDVKKPSSSTPKKSEKKDDKKSDKKSDKKDDKKSKK